MYTAITETTAPGDELTVSDGCRMLLAEYSQHYDVTMEEALRRAVEGLTGRCPDQAAEDTFPVN